MKKHPLLELIIIIIAGLLYFYLLLILTKEKTFRLDSDYDMIYAMYTYVVEHARTYHTLPRTHPYAGMGMPLAGDPSVSYYNPLFLFPLVLFGMTRGLFIVILLMIILSGASMWLLLRALGMPSWIRVAGSILFMVSGAFAARVGAGHIFILTYPAWPIIIYALLKQLPILLGVTTAYMFLSGDIYGVWFTVIFTVIAFAYYLMTKQCSKATIIRYSILAARSFLLLSLIKLYFFLVDVLPVFERTYHGHPSEGSIHLWWTLLPFIIPFKVLFYDRPFFQRHLGFFFNWYEYYAFLSPFVFLLVAPIIKRGRTIVRDPKIAVLLVLFFLGILYISLAYPYAPFYWLFAWLTPLHIFRVPQRMYLPLTAIVITIVCVGANMWKQKTLAMGMFFCGLTATTLASLHAMTMGFEYPRNEERHLVQTLKTYNKNNESTYTTLCCLQRFLVEEHIPIFNFYAGWKVKNTPSFPDEYLPRYILSSKKEDFSHLSYKKIDETSLGTIWER